MRPTIKPYNRQSIQAITYPLQINNKNKKISKPTSNPNSKQKPEIKHHVNNHQVNLQAQHKQQTFIIN